MQNRPCAATEQVVVRSALRVVSGSEVSVSQGSGRVADTPAEVAAFAPTTPGLRVDCQQYQPDLYRVEACLEQQINTLKSQEAVYLERARWADQERLRLRADTGARIQRLQGTLGD